MKTEQIELVIKLFPSLSDISIEDWNEDGISIASLPVDHVIYEGEFLEHAALILDGTVRMYKLSDSGREVTLYRISSGECCPMMASSILGESVYEASACIEKPTTVLFIPVRIFQKWMNNYLGFRQYIFKTFARRLIVMSNLIDSVVFKTIRSRISEYLLLMTSSDNNSLSITHDVLSIELGTAREVISRTLKSMENDGLLRASRGQITHIQRERLQELID
ncbi:Crp/Fnr family transcriptional regulator [Paenibacillus sp. GSMTC-2017]|uniref:Crp/Fnr family transcriptional regulator n=1 Tax=Paenibacillus sp. GSMTC-2017 TaxID=2794350 RepID=UPI0018D9F4EB|nr:Crp/Fnr family transcriptional regulator [Paenibacillus sp. GSMTC-2017]MBH5319822.1 Crp/Fnr family transcriptional regulator [Paenibacillus sp. GSMTC-2017]